MLLLFKSNAITLQKESYNKIKDMFFYSSHPLRHRPTNALEFQKLLFYNLLQSNFSHFTE